MLTLSLAEPAGLIPAADSASAGVPETRVPLTCRAGRSPVSPAGAVVGLTASRSLGLRDGSVSEAGRAGRHCGLVCVPVSSAVCNSSSSSASDFESPLLLLRMAGALSAAATFRSTGGDGREL